VRTAKGAEAIFASGTTATLLTEQASNENARFSSGRCLRHRRRDVLRAAWRLIADIFAGLCRGLDAHSHVARLRRHHRRCCVFADRPLDDALSPAASIAERGVGSLSCAFRGRLQSASGQAISAVQPGAAEILRRKLCNLMIAATMLKPRPKPLMFLVWSER